MIALLAALAVADTASPLPIGRYTVDANTLQTLPNAYSVNTVLEMLVLPATVSNIDVGGLSKPDMLKLSIFGDSNTQTHFSIGGIDMTDPLHAGAPAMHIPFLAIGTLSVVYQENVDTIGEGVDFTLREDGPRLAVGARSVVPNMGGITPGAVTVMKALAGSHPLLVSPLPASDRRRFDENVGFTLLGNTGAWTYAADFDQGQRRFLHFVGQDLVGALPEGFTLASAVAHNARLGLTFAVDFEQRQRVGAEFFYGADETFARQSLAAFAGWKTKYLRMGLTAKVEHDDATNIGFTREARDPDGQGLFPFSPRGTRFGTNFDATYEAPIGTATKAFAHLGERAVVWMPSVASWSNPITLDGVAQGRIDFSSLPTAYMYGEIQAGLRDRRMLGDFEIGYSAYAMHTHMVSLGRSDVVSLFDVGVKAHVQWRRSHWFMPYLAFSRAPIPLTQNVAEQLDPNVLRGRSYGGDTLYDTTGNTLSVAPGLAAPKNHALSLGFETEFSSQWRFFFMTLAKTYDDTLWTQFASANPTQNSGDRAFLTAGAKRYELTNFPFQETPFYVGAHAQIVGSDPRRYFFMLGLSAYFSLGTTAFGFGPLANDMGIVDTSMANPNTRRFPVGNLEGDRAYYIKTGFGWRLIDTLWASIGVRYRDGRPFTYFDYRAQGGQVQASYIEPKGSLYNRNGPREGARVNVDLKIAYTLPLPHVALRLAFVVSNAFDLGAPISERQFPGSESIRSTLELEPPRQGMLTAELFFP